MSAAAGANVADDHSCESLAATTHHTKSAAHAKLSTNLHASSVAGDSRSVDTTDMIEEVVPHVYVVFRNASSSQRPGFVAIHRIAARMRTRSRLTSSCSPGSGATVIASPFASGLLAAYKVVPPLVETGTNWPS